MVQIVLIWPPSIRSSEWRGIISITSAVWSTSRLSTRTVTFHALHVTLERYHQCDVTYGQVWWPILGICALHLTHPKCTHTAVNTHTPWTHTRSSGQPFYAAAPGEQLGVQCLAQGHLSRSTFTPPTYNSCRPETRTRDLWVTSPTL